MHLSKSWNGMIANLLLVLLLGVQHGTTAPVKGHTTAISALPISGAEACGPDTCDGGGSCTVRGPFSGSMPELRSSFDCTTFSTKTTDVLPTASTAPKSSLSQHSGKDKNGILDKRQNGEEDGQANPEYASSVSAFITDHHAWLSRQGLVSGRVYTFPEVYGAAGVNGLAGCTVVAIISQSGVYFAHLTEVGVFVKDPSRKEKTTDEEFWHHVHILDSGNEQTGGISSLIGTEQKPGPLHAFHSPRVYVLAPRTNRFDRMWGTTTELAYQDRSFQLMEYLTKLVPGSSGSVKGYEKETSEDITGRSGYKGKIFVEATAQDHWVDAACDPMGQGYQAGRWRLWSHGTVIAQDIYMPLFP